MQLILFFLLCFCLFIQCCVGLTEKECKETKREQELREKETELFTKAFEGNIGAVKSSIQLAKELLYSSSSTTISERQRQGGFNRINLVGSYFQIEVSDTDKKKLLELEGKRSYLSTYANDAIQTRIKEFLETLQLTTYSGTLVEYSLTFQGVGRIYMLKIRCLTDPVTNHFHYGRVLLQGDFSLAPDYFIVTKSKSSLLSSSSHQEIVYVDRPMTVQDAEDLARFFYNAAATMNSVMIDESKPEKQRLLGSTNPTK